MTANNQKTPTTVTLSGGQIEDVLWSGFPDFTLGSSPFRFGGWVAQLFMLICGIILFVDSYQTWGDAFRNGITWSLKGKISTYQPFRMFLTPFGVLLTLMAVFWKIPLRWLHSRTIYLITRSGVFILDAHTRRIRLELPFSSQKNPTLNGDYIEFYPIHPANWLDVRRKLGPFPEPKTAYKTIITAWSAQNRSGGIPPDNSISSNTPPPNNHPPDNQP